MTPPPVVSTKKPGPVRYVAFLRGINVGGRTVKMDRLKKSFQALKFSGVETFIASGNVIFSCSGRDVAALESRIEKRLRRDLGFDVITYVRTIDEVAAIAGDRSSADSDGCTLFVGLLRTAPAAALRAALTTHSNPENEVVVKGREIYWLCRTKLSLSVLSYGVMEKALAAKATFRNVNTMRRLTAKYRI